MKFPNRKPVLAVYSGSYCRTHTHTHMIYTHTESTSEIRQPGGGGVKLRGIYNNITHTLRACAYVCVYVCDIRKVVCVRVPRVG